MTASRISINVSTVREQSLIPPTGTGIKGWSMLARETTVVNTVSKTLPSNGCSGVINMSTIISGRRDDVAVEKNLTLIPTTTLTRESAKSSIRHQRPSPAGFAGGGIRAPKRHIKYDRVDKEAFVCETC